MFDLVETPTHHRFDLVETPTHHRFDLVEILRYLQRAIWQHWVDTAPDRLDTRRILLCTQVSALCSPWSKCSHSRCICMMDFGSHMLHEILAQGVIWAWLEHDEARFSKFLFLRILGAYFGVL